MKYGLEDIELEQITEVFSRYPAIDKVILFGSRAMGKEKPGSDIDLAIKGENLTYDDTLEIQLSLENLNFLLKFDIINFNMITDPAVLDHIDRVGIILYTRLV
jgi:uncharacterized protein